MTQREQNSNCFCSKAAMRQQQSLMISCDTLFAVVTSVALPSCVTSGLSQPRDRATSVRSKPGIARPLKMTLCMSGVGKIYHTVLFLIINCRHKSAFAAHILSSATPNSGRAHPSPPPQAAGVSPAFAPWTCLRQKAGLQLLTSRSGYKPFAFIHGHNPQRARRRPNREL